MVPNPIPLEPGCLSILLHPGSFPPAIKFLPVVPKPVAFLSKKIVPVMGAVGTNDPAVWREIIWWDGRAFTAKLLCDIPGHYSTFETLKDHFERHPQVWEPLTSVR